MEWLYFFAAAVVIALGIGLLMYCTYGDGEDFIRGFSATLIFEAFLTLIGALLWLGLKGYVGP